MIIEKSNGNEELEVVEIKMEGYQEDVEITQDFCDGIRIDKQQAAQLVVVLQKWINGEEIE